MNWEAFLSDAGIDVPSLQPGDVITLPTTPPKRKAAGLNTSRSDSPAERLFDDAWSLYGDPTAEMVSQFKFHPTRRWKADRAFPAHKVLVEIEGMTSQGHEGRHRSWTGFMGDCEKYNAALMGGYVVYRIPSIWLSSGKNNRAQQVCEELVQLLKNRAKERIPHETTD